LRYTIDNISHFENKFSVFMESGNNFRRIRK
jgi:hypothetical protein